MASVFFLASGLSSTFVPIYLYGVGGDSLLFVLGVLTLVFLTLGVAPLLLQWRLASRFPRLLPSGILALGAFQLSLPVLHLPVLLGLSWGLGLALFWPPFNTYLYSVTSGAKKIQEITVIAVAIPALAGVAGPAIGGLIASTPGLGFHTIFLLAGGLFLAACLLSLQLPRLEEGHGGAAAPHALRVRGVSRFAIAYALLGFTDTSWIIYPLYLYALAGRSLLYLGLVVSAISLFGAFVSPLTARWADRQRTAWVPAMLGYVVAAVTLLALGTINELWQAAVLGLAGCAGGLQVALLRAYTNLFPKGSLASAATVREMSLNLGRLANVGFTFLLVGTAPLTLALFHRYYLAVGSLALSIPLWIAATRLQAPDPATGPLGSRVGAWARRFPIPGLR